MSLVRAGLPYRALAKAKGKKFMEEDLNEWAWFSAERLSPHIATGVARLGRGENLDSHNDDGIDPDDDDWENEDFDCEDEDRPPFRRIPTESSDDVPQL
jgi:hypothetical protein